MVYTTADAIAAALIVLAVAAIAATDLAIRRHRNRRARDLERLLGAGRYATGCPRDVTKTDLDKAIEDYVTALYEGQIGVRLAITVRRLEQLLGIPIEIRSSARSADDNAHAQRSHHYERSFR